MNTVTYYGLTRLCSRQALSTSATPILSARATSTLQAPGKGLRSIFHRGVGSTLATCDFSPADPTCHNSRIFCGGEITPPRRRAYIEYTPVEDGRLRCLHFHPMRTLLKLSSCL